jgi:cyclophilin family peptidyl-prolyl cis-trans isomerase
MLQRSWLAAALVAVLFCQGCGDSTSEGPKPVVVIDTSMGKIKVELDEGKAPITVKNFLEYVDAKFYDDTVFHRVIGTFMIQGGGFTPAVSKAKTEDEFKAAQKKTRPPIKNEASNGLHNVRGTIAMARTNDPDSATAQWFINVVDNSGKLDRNNRSAGYCVFGKVIDGMDVVDKIRKVETMELLPQINDVPVQDVIIKSIRRVEK